MRYTPELIAAINSRYDLCSDCKHYHMTLYRDSNNNLIMVGYS